MIINNYEINDGTLAIMAIEDGNTKILEDNKTFIIKDTTYNIIDHSCKYFGSSYNGRKEGSKEILGIGYKVPIIVEDSKNIVFFPTSSVEKDDCVWIAVNKIKNYYEENYNTTKITFINGKELILPFSYRTVENQVLRATRLSYIIKNHREN